MNKIMPLALRKEQNHSKQIRVELQVNGNKITCLTSKVSELKLAQKKFAEVLSKPHPPVVLNNVNEALKNLNQNMVVIKNEVQTLKTFQSKLNNQMLFCDSKIEKLTSCLKAKKNQEDDHRQSEEIEELSLLSRLNTANQPTKDNIISPLFLKPDLSDVINKKLALPLNNIEASINGTLKLNESQSVQVNIDATSNLNCEVLITATKGTTEGLINSSKDQLKKQIQQHGLTVSDLEVVGV